MGKSIPFEVRRQIVRLHTSGKNNTLISAETGVSISGIKKLLQSYRQLGDAAFQTQYFNCGKNAPKIFEDFMIAEIMRRTEKSPGAPFVNSVLASQNPSTKTPHYRTIQRWWAKTGKRKQEKKQGNSPKISWTKEPHHTWQIDGKEQIALSDGTQVCWMNIADEATSTALQTEVFPPNACN
jgi:hypothetical protein